MKVSDTLIVAYSKVRKAKEARYVVYTMFLKHKANAKNWLKMDESYVDTIDKYFPRTIPVFIIQAAIDVLIIKYSVKKRR